MTLSKKARKVGVVGEGVSGLSCAIRAAENGNQVTVVASDEGSQTTSSVAAAFWYPFWTGQEPDHSWYQPLWAEHTLQIFETLLTKPDAGISQVILYEYFSEEMSDQEIHDIISAMWWRNLPAVEFRELRSNELESRF